MKRLIAVLLLLIGTVLMSFAEDFLDDAMRTKLFDDAMRTGLKEKVIVDGNYNAYKQVEKVFEDATTVGETVGVISGYATNSDSFNEFADNIREHEFQSETLQKAQDWGKKIGDAVADVYIWATSDD